MCLSINAVRSISNNCNLKSLERAVNDIYFYVSKLIKISNCQEDILSWIHYQREKTDSFYELNSRCDRRYDCTDESDEFNCIVSDYKRYLSSQQGKDFKADELSITALFTIIGPVMFGVSVLLFVLKLRASFRTTSNTPAGNRGRRIDVNDIEPVLFVTGQSVEMNNYGAHLTTSHV